MQYVPDSKRGEGLNCGLLMLCPENKYLDIRINPNISRLSHVFRNKSVEHIKAQIRYAKTQVISQKTRLLTDDSYLYLPMKPFNEVRFLPLITINEIPEDVERYHNQLFCELVDEEDSMLVHSVRIMLEHINDNLFLINKRGQISEHDKIVFSRANDLLTAADMVRDLIDD